MGSEAWYASMERQIELMKDMGVNAYRTSHNPVSDEMIDICNKKGMLVMEEAYDGWKAYKLSLIHILYRLRLCSKEVLKEVK